VCHVEQVIYGCGHHITTKNEPYKSLSFTRLSLFELLLSEFRNCVIMQVDGDIPVED
jgi:hypothetical protein